MAKLSDLKSLLEARRKLSPPADPESRKTAPPARRELARTKHADGDVDLKQAFADVEPLTRVNRIPRAKPRPAAVAAKRLEDEADALAASKYGVEPAPSSWDIGQEHEAEQTFLRAGLATDILTKLRRGHWAIQGEIDLHRLTSDEARAALAEFLFDARARGWRCVRVIHGKGLSSPNREPVLKGKVRRLLGQWDDVLAYCEAPRHAGGGGAVLALLKT